MLSILLSILSSCAQGPGLPSPGGQGSAAVTPARNQSSQTGKEFNALSPESINQALGTSVDSQVGASQTSVADNFNVIPIIEVQTGARFP